MTAPRQRTGNLLVTRSEQRTTAGKLPTRKFPVQREIQKLERDLNALNERIAELEDEGHRGHAMDVLKANAMTLHDG
jgi:chaperonin cofactor prefoldin